jgi:hypothetical protein
MLQGRLAMAGPGCKGSGSSEVHPIVIVLELELVLGCGPDAQMKERFCPTPQVEDEFD